MFEIKITEIIEDNEVVHNEVYSQRVEHLNVPEVVALIQDNVAREQDRKRNQKEDEYPGMIKEVEYLGQERG